MFSCKDTHGGGPAENIPQFTLAEYEEFLEKMSVRANPSTFCNPVNISYQYQTGYKSRESADPAAIVYRGEYYLFASHGSGYWWSDDLVNWNFVYSTMPEIGKFAPAAYVVGDELYLTHSNSGAIYKSSNPKGDAWVYVGHPFSWEDPALFTDDDGRVYAYQGLSPTMPITGMELNPNNNMALIGEPVELFNSHKAARGFEVAGNNNDAYNSDCWLEGAWMTKHNGKYYLQYAVPGTEYESYANGYFVSDAPLGAFEPAKNSPVSYKASGFIRGAGHGSTVQDLNGNWWKFDTVSISVNHMFERRLIMFPANFDQNGNMAANLLFSDYPLYVPHSGLGTFDKPGPGWNLLSYNKGLGASSSLTGHPVSNAFNENMRTWWSAETGNSGEWLTADLGRPCKVAAVQINFADQDIDDANGRGYGHIYRYLLEFSIDGNKWFPAVDRSDAAGEPFKARDTSHDYFEFDDTDGLPYARYIRLINKGPVPANGKFAVSGLRLFGTDHTRAPGSVTGFTVNRLKSDERSVNVSWSSVSGAEGYMILFGAAGSGMRTHYQVIGNTNTRKINILNMGVNYEFAIFAYGPGGTGPLSSIKNVPATVPVPEPPVTEPIPPARLPEKAEGYTVYEAEDSQFGGSVFISRSTEDAPASGGATLHNMHIEGAYFELRNVDGGNGGNAVLRLCYSNGNPQAKTEIYLNGNTLGVFTLPSTGGWNVFMRIDIPISGLTAGATNTIRFVGGQEGFNPDFVQAIYER
jgi:hypothetical protein